jgi:hypothetical protein
MAQRAWFRIHLSTAIALVLVCGVLLGLNLRKRTERLVCNEYAYMSQRSATVPSRLHNIYRIEHNYSGWPIDAYMLHGDQNNIDWVCYTTSKSDPVEQLEVARVHTHFELSESEYLKYTPTIYANILAQRVRTAAHRGIRLEPSVIQFNSDFRGPWKRSAVVINCAVAIAVLVAIAVICEWRIRRKTRALS